MSTERDPRDHCPNSRRWSDKQTHHEFKGLACRLCGAKKKRRKHAGPTIEVSHTDPDWDGSKAGIALAPGEKRELYGITVMNENNVTLYLERIKFAIQAPGDWK
jgi:hypothetical protein